MALASKYHIQLTSADGVTDVVQLHQEGFVGTSTELRGADLDGRGNAFVFRKGTASDEIWTPLVSTEYELALLPVLQATGAFDASVLSDLKTIPTAGPREWLLLHLRGGAEQWRGWVMPRFTTVPLHSNSAPIRIVAKDRLLALDDQPHLDGSGDFLRGKATVASQIATLLLSTGHTLPIREESTRKPSAMAGRPLDMQVDRIRWSEQREETAPRQAHRRGTVLRTLMLSYGVSCFQWAGRWELVRPMSKVLGVSLAAFRDYTSAGVYSGGFTRAAYFDGESLRFDPQSQEGRGEEPLRRAAVTYTYGDFDVSTLKNGRLSASHPTQGQYIPDGWTALGGTVTTDYRRYLRGDPSATRLSGIDDMLYGYGILQEVVSVGSDIDTKRAACTKFLTQDAGIFTAGTDGLRILFRYAAVVNEIATGRAFAQTQKVRASEAFYRMKFVDSSNTYYLDGADDAWYEQSTMTEAEKRIRMTGTTNETYVVTRLSLEVMNEIRTLPALPGSGAGTLTVELGCVVYENVAPHLSDTEVWVVYADVVLDRGDSEAAPGITYEVVDSSVTEGLEAQETLLIGDGPSAAAPGAIFETDGATLAEEWESEVGEGEDIAHTQLVAEEIMRYARSARRRIRLTSTEAQPQMTPNVPVEFDGARYWPVYFEMPYPSLKPTIEGLELKDSGRGSLDTDIFAGELSGALLGGGSRAGILTNLSDRLGILGSVGAITELTADIASGSQTQATINPVGTVFVKDGESFSIIPLYRQDTVITLTADGDYTPGSSTIDFLSHSFSEDVHAGSLVFTGIEDLLTRVVITENGFSVVVEGREIGSVGETIAPGGQRGPVAGTLLLSSPGLNYAVFNEQYITIVNNGPGGDGTKYGAKLAPIKIDGEQAAGDTTFAIKANGGGDVTFSNGLVIGSTIQYLFQRDLAPTALNVFFNTIELRAKQITMLADSHFKSDNWDGTLDGSNRITAAGTQGICFTGDGDMDVTGTLHAGAGSVLIDVADGILIESSGSKTQNRSIAFVDDPASPTVEYLSLWGNTTLGEAYVETDPGNNLNLRANAPSGGGAGTPYVQVNTSGQIALVPTSGSNIELYGTLRFAEAAAPSTPATGYGYLYEKTDGKIYFKNDSGSEYDLTQGGSAGTYIEDADTDTYVKVEESADEDVIHFSTAGVERFRIASGGDLRVMDSGSQFRAADGTAGAPAITFESDQTLGVFASTNILGFAVAGAEVFRAVAGGLQVTGNVEQQKAVITTNGLSTAPSITRSTDTDTGFYFPSANILGIATGAASRATWDSAGLNLASGSNILFTGGDVRTSGQLDITNSGATETLASFVPNAEVGLYYNNSLKFATSNVGGTLTGDLTVTGDVNITAGYLEVSEQTAPATPSTGFGRLYAKSDSKLYFKNDGGTEYDLTAGSGSVTGPGSSTDNAIVRWDGAGGGTLQNSSVTIDDTGHIFAASGTAAAPPYAFSADPDNGMYYVTTNTIGFATAGVSRLTIGTATIDLTSMDIDMTGGSIHLDASEFIGFGGTSPATETLQIGYSSGNKIIADVSLTFLTQAVSPETMCVMTEGGAVSLYYNDNLKFATVNGGVDITGNCEADSYSVGGAAGASYSGTTPASMTVVNGIITAIT